MCLFFFAFSIHSTTWDASSVLLRTQETIFLEYRSITHVRYTNELKIGKGQQCDEEEYGGMDAEELEKIWNQDKLEYTDGYTVEQREKIIEDVKREFEEKDTLQNASAVHFADVLLQNMGLGKYIDDAGKINIHRDKMINDG